MSTGAGRPDRGDSRIADVIGRRIWDSRGRPTIEAEVVLNDGTRGLGMAPAGASRGQHEAVERRDGGPAFGGYGVSEALSQFPTLIRPALLGLDALDQARVDDALIALDGTAQKTRLGGNATTAVSIAVLQAAARSAGRPLYRHLSPEGSLTLPLPEVQIFGGGAHAGRRIDLQDLLVMPVGAASFDEALAMCAEVYRAGGQIMQENGALAGVADEGGWWPQFRSNEEALERLAQAIDRAGYRNGEVRISIDAAASEFGAAGRYRLGLEGRELDRDGWLETLIGWVQRFDILSVEDPCSEDDAAGMRAFTAAVGSRVQVIGDDYLVTHAQRVRDAAAQAACNAVLIKPNQAGTVSEARAALLAGQEAGFGTVVSARSGETEDTTIMHLAVGWHAGQLKVGSFSRSERMAKWNEGLRIEAALGPLARFAGAAALPMHRLRRPSGPQGT
jgi:enolase